MVKTLISNKSLGKVWLLIIVMLWTTYGFRPSTALNPSGISRSAFQQNSNNPNTSAADPIKWVLSKQCTLKVNGSTNINKFSCLIPEYTQPDTLILKQETKRQRVKITGSMILDVQKFDCRNAMMTNDLRKTLKAKVYPKLIVTFEDLSSLPDPGTPNAAIKGAVTIELAGAVKRFEVDYQYVLTGDKTLRLIGTKKVNFSDFNIDPPKRLGGMIKTNNELNVEFMLNIKILN